MTWSGAENLTPEFFTEPPRPSARLEIRGNFKRTADRALKPVMRGNLIPKALILLILVEIPAIAVDVLKHNDHPVLFLTWLLTEVNALSLHSVIVAPEVVCL